MTIHLDPSAYYLLWAVFGGGVTAFLLTMIFGRRWFPLILLVLIPVTSYAQTGGSFTITLGGGGTLNDGSIGANPGAGWGTVDGSAGGQGAQLLDYGGYLQGSFVQIYQDSTLPNGLGGTRSIGCKVYRVGSGFACDVLIDGSSLGTMYGVTGRPDTTGTFGFTSSGTPSPVLNDGPILSERFASTQYWQLLGNRNLVPGVTVKFPAGILSAPATQPGGDPPPTTQAARVDMGTSVNMMHTTITSAYDQSDFANLDGGQGNMSPFAIFLAYPDMTALGPACSTWDHLAVLFGPESTRADSTKVGSVNLIEGGFNGYVHILMGAYSDMAAEYAGPLGVVKIFNNFAVAFACLRMNWRKAVSALGMSDADDVGIPGVGITD